MPHGGLNVRHQSRPRKRSGSPLATFPGLGPSSLAIHLRSYEQSGVLAPPEVAVVTASSPTVVLIGGPNGAGKSTLAPVLLRDTAGIVEFVNADTIAHGLSAFRPEAVAFEAGRVMLQRLKDLARRGEDFAFESTLATRSYAPWISELRKQGYAFRLFFLWLHSPDLAVERVRERVRLGGHDVPEDVVRRRYDAGLRNFSALYRPLADAWRVYDNSEPGEMPLVASGSGSTTTVRDPDVWRQIGGGDT